jgi:hypothetical protein
VPPPAAAPVTLTLSNGHASFAFREVGKGEAAVITWSVAYRLTGQPSPDEWYLVSAETGDVGSGKEVRGGELKPEGVFNGESILLKVAPPSITIKVQRSKGPRKGSYENKPVGGPITVQVEYRNPQ